ncbi:MAG: hypothetical protein RR232_01020 [Clostridia bacterium]
MKKFIYMMMVVLSLFALSGCSSTIDNYDGLIEKAREEIPLADIENMDVQIAGTTDVDGSSLIWFVTGNEYQKHSYFPIEFGIIGEHSDKYRFVKTYKAYEREQDIAVYPWNGYSFVINNDKCAKIILTFEDGSVEELEIAGQLPIVCSTALTPKSYIFVDRNGDEIG